MKIIQVKSYSEIPSGFTGIAEHVDGTKCWYKEGKYHREDGPAVEGSDGTKCWYKEGKYHREDGPAYEGSDGTKCWYLDGTRFSSEEEWKIELEKRNLKTIRVKSYSNIPSGFTGIAEYSHGTKQWFKKGKLHREDGPACEWSDGTKSWWRNGKFHREDGPACEYANGSKSWYLNGIEFSSEGEWKAELEKRSLKTIQVKNPYDIPSGFTGIAEYPNGLKEWYVNGKLHRDDGPATEWIDGSKRWYKDGKYHREDGPAIEHSDGIKEWFKEGKRHREYGPAIEWPDGTKLWFLNGIGFSFEEWKAELEKQNMKTIRVKDSSEIPSGFTGIAEYSNGTKSWFKEGRLHREGGPAAEYADGTKEWFKEGKRHREDGPAVEYAGGSKSWFKEGKLHREDGPAIECADGRKFWYLDGAKFYSETAWKAELEKRNIKTIQIKDSFEIPSGFTGITEYSNGTKSWWREGKLHREDGPAAEYPDGTKSWFIEGKRHREDGPACEYANGSKSWYLNGIEFSSEGEWKAELEKRSLKTIRVKQDSEIPSGFTGIAEWPNGTKSWWREGKLHREDGPAVEYADGEKRWFKEGKLHREDGPAIVWPDGKEHWWYKEGKLHRENGPAVEYAGGAKYWWRNGKLHREDGPAVEYANGTKFWYLEGIEFSSEEKWKIELEKRSLKTIRVKQDSEIPSGFTGIAEYPNGLKEWYVNGKLHRDDGPATEWIDGSKEWYKEGKLHREDGPAREYSNGTKVWYLEGLRHREDGPACEYADGGKRWFKEGLCHREDGPAVEYADGGKRWFKEGLCHREDGPAVEYANGTKFWYLEGIEFSSEEKWKIELEKRNMKTIQIKDYSEIPSGFTGIAEWPNGTKEWYKEGKLHRKDGPACEYPDGSKFWYVEGSLHREDGPAVESANGTKFWYKEGKYHREDGPACEYASGSKSWHLNGIGFSSEGEWKAELEKRSLKTIRVKNSSEIPSGFTGIAEWPNGTKAWYKEGKLHREDGPACEYADGSKDWFINGTRIHLNINVEIDAKKLNDVMEEKMISQKNNISQVKTESSLKSDGKKMAKRAGARKIINLMTGFLVGILSMGKTKKQTSAMKTAIADWLKTDQGTIVLGWLLGTLLPMFLEHLPEKYHAIAREMAEEFRVEAGSKALEIAVDFLTGPMFSGTKTALMTVFDSVMNAEEPSGIRAVLDSKGTESTEVESSFSKEASNQTST